MRVHIRRPLWLVLTSASLVASWTFAPTAAADRSRFSGRVFSGSALTGEPVIGVFPNARPMIPNAASDSSIPRTRIRGFPSRRAVADGVIVAPPLLYGPVVSPVEVPPVLEQPAATPPVTINIVTAAPPPPPAAPPERTVIEYSDGRFELRGDGEGKPYRWVWIPNPPAPPSSSAADSGLYGWVDERGAMHVTDRWESIPAQYREQAKRNKGS